MKQGLIDEVLLLQIVTYHNQQYCEPPLAESTLKGLVRSKLNRVTPDPLPNLIPMPDDPPPDIHTKERSQDESTATVTHLVQPTDITGSLVTYDYFTLFNTDLPEPDWLIKGLLPWGLTLVVGHPKMGKSWLALNIARDLATGKKVFGYFDCEPIKILMLQLEDPHLRIKKRGRQIMEACENSKNIIYSTYIDKFAHPSEKKNNPQKDGFRDLCNHLTKHPDIKLVTIDTWQRIRPTIKRGQDDYDWWGDHLAEIHRFAHEKGIAFIIMHHLGKTERDSENEIQQILGSTSITASVDTIWVVRRKVSKGTMTCQGRDYEEELDLSFHCEKGLWKCLGNTRDVTRSKTQQSVLDALAVAEQPLLHKDLVKAVGLPKSSVSEACNAL